MKMEMNKKTSSLSGLGVGGVADTYIEIESKTQWGHVWKIVRSGKTHILGGGFNTVFGDLYDGTIIKLCGEFQSIKPTQTGLICGGGASLSRACNIAKLNGLSGLEGLLGVHGSVGGGVFGNCGAFGREISDVVEWVEVTTRGGEMRISKSLCGFGYRTSKLPQNGVVTAVCLKLEKGDPEEISKREIFYKEKRVATQPLESKSCGSVYKRVGEIIPAQLIDGAGLKGVRIGGLEVSKKHAGFIVNTGGGTPKDFEELTDIIEMRVFEKYKVMLEKEIKFIGINK